MTLPSSRRCSPRSRSRASRRRGPSRSSWGHWLRWRLSGWPRAWRLQRWLRGSRQRRSSRSRSGTWETPSSCTEGGLRKREKGDKMVSSWMAPVVNSVSPLAAQGRQKPNVGTDQRRHGRIGSGWAGFEENESGISFIPGPNGPILIIKDLNLGESICTWTDLSCS